MSDSTTSPAPVDDRSEDEPTLVRTGVPGDDRRPWSRDRPSPPWRDRRLQRVRRGAYTDAAAWTTSDEDRRHLVRAHAVTGAARTPPVLSHGSAAVVHGLPLVGRRDDRVHVVRGAADGGRSRGDVVRHTVEDVPDPVTVGGLLVTDVARTIVDLARADGVVAGVVAGDHALRLRVTTRAEVAAEVERLRPGARGRRRACDALRLLDGRSESPGESLSRVRMDEAGLPVPMLQHEVHDRVGFAGRVDFWWPDHGVVGEFDGRSKYGATGTAAADAVWREKLREDRLRASGARVVRWTWRDAWDRDPMIRLLRSAGVR